MVRHNRLKICRLRGIPVRVRFPAPSFKLESGLTKSCGCLRKETTAALARSRAKTN